MKYTVIISLIFLLAGCTGLPENIKPVDNFNVQSYLGRWYEIARLDHAFERGLSNISADYSLRKDGGINVVNQGFSEQQGRWKKAQGKAYFVGDPSIGHLKVSFFGPFYGAYVIFKLDTKAFQYAYVTSHNKDFLWLLSRTPEVSGAIKQDFLKTAADNGFNVKEIIFVSQAAPEKAL